jgi:hypothetical protein
LVTACSLLSKQPSLEVILMCPVADDNDGPLAFEAVVERSRAPEIAEADKLAKPKSDGEKK